MLSTCLLQTVVALVTLGVDGDSLKWTVDAETSRLTVQRVEDRTEWRGEALAEVGYWDGDNKERSKLITPAEGWKCERRTNRIVCRQEALGFLLVLDFAVAGDVMTVSARAADMKESGVARLKTLRLLPRFGAAAEGDEGHLVIAQQSGALCHFRDKKPGQHFVSVYQSSCQCPMPIFGMVRDKSAVAGIITGGQFDARVCVSTCWAPQKLYAIDPVFTLRSFREETRLPDDIAVEYHFLPAAEANWLGMGKRYRQLNFTRRGIRPLRERTAASPGLAYSAGALEVRIRLGVKPVPHEIKEQTLETEPPMRVFCDFARMRDILNEFHRQGIARTEFCLVGWNRGGHDGRYPQIFPVEPKLGGEAALRATIKHGQSLGYQMVAHDCYTDAYRISEDWSEEYLRKNPDGIPRKGGAWGGGQSYNVCLARAYDLFAKRNFTRTRTLGFEGLHYSDVLSIIGPFPCYDTKHPQTRRQDAEATVRILALAQKTFGGVQSEGSLDFTAPALDRLLYVDCDKWLPLMKRPYVDTLVPLFETVYHGTLLYSLSTDTVNSQPGEAAYLKTIEYGAAPLAYFYGHFVLDPTKNWLGKRDYRYDDAAGLKQIVTSLRRVHDDVERLKHLQMEFIEGHRKIADEVFETAYSNGQRVVVNYREQPHTLPSGGVVPALGWLLLPADGQPSDQQLRAKAEEAWRAAWDRFYDDRTHLFYDYVCSYDPAKRFAALPTPEEIRRQYPNPNGWGTGMEDCAISGGLMMAMLCDQFAVTHDATLRPLAAKVFAGLASLVTLSATEGFVSRGICPGDKRSHYPESSRDQYTWHVYGLWRYYHSPLSQPGEKAAIRNIITAICRRLERNVVAANNYSIGKDTGAFDGIVDKMWENMAHEIARLPMIYAIGADVTGDSHWKELARRYNPEAAAKSKEESTKIPYALLQEQVSLEVLHQLEESPELKRQWLEAMQLVADRAQVFLGKCLKYQPPTGAPFRFDWRAWPLRKSSIYQVPTRPDDIASEDRTIREPAEAALVQLLCPRRSLTPEQLALMKRTIAQVDYDKVVFYGHYYTQAVYWRALRLGVLTLPAEKEPNP